MAIDAALNVVDLQKRYAATVALESVSLCVRRGEVHALLGENGAGKSTLVKILSGLARPDSGTIEIFGKPAILSNPKTSHRFGIRTAFQEISLVKDLSVAQNFLLMEEPTALSVIRRRRMYAQVEESLHSLGLDSINPYAKVRDLDLPSRQKIEIARAVSRRPQIILLDEPTAALLSNDVEWLGGLIEKMKAAGTTIIFISHRMQEVRSFCGALTILRNGRNVGSFDVNEISDNDVFERMIGRSVSAVFPPRPALSESSKSDRKPVLSVRGLTTSGALAGISFDLFPGQILGVGGLHGMGQRELFLALFGATETSSGEIRVGDTPVRLRSPADAIRPEVGISLVPEDRKTEGLFLELDGTRNVSLPSQSRFELAGLIKAGAERAAVSEVFQLVQVPPRALWSPVKQLSGGNQQKIVIAKWLLTGSRVLLLYDPTRGVDIGTKAEIYRLAREFVEAGGAILFYSTDIPELVNLCDDVLVIYRGTITASLSGDELSDAGIMRAAVGHVTTHAAGGSGV
jgi:ribose transport system ATP-binding protein